ncbi:hypothetical protein A2U01_0115345, partial [Trifolium medium]|nr:hypothetical protein [Trifolium medium]
MELSFVLRRLVVDTMVAQGCEQG